MRQPPLLSRTAQASPEAGFGPSLSLRERDRRWWSVRQLMQQRGLVCLIVVPSRGRDQLGAYLIDDQIDGSVVFPLGGEPVVQTWYPPRVSRALESQARGEALWVTDYRVGVGGPALASLIRELGFDNGRIGVVGLEWIGPGEAAGSVPYTFWANLTGELPAASFVDVTPAFAGLMLIKSQQEMALVRHAAAIGEAASQAMLEATRPGVGEETIYAEIMYEVFRHAADARYPTLILHSGPSASGWGPPRWIVRAEHPRRVQEGDVVQACILPCYGNQEVQVQMAIALDPVDSVSQRCEELARRSYEAGLRALKPGITLGELAQAMQRPLREAGAGSRSPLAHLLSPSSIGHLDGAGDEPADNAAPPAQPEPGSGAGLVLRPRMALALQPNVCLDGHCLGIGGTVLVTTTGCEELNVLPTRVQHVG